MLSASPFDASMLHALLDAIPARVVAIDREHRFVFVNAEALDFLHLRPAQIVGRHVADVLGPAYERYLPLHERLFERRETFRTEGWMDYPVIGRRYVQEHFFPHAPGGGEVRAAFVFVRDLTDLKTHEAELSAQVQALQTSETLKSAIVDHTLAALVSCDAQGRIVEFNPAAEHMFGHRRDAVLGQEVGATLVPPRHRAAHAAGLARANRGDPARVMGRRVEMDALHASGREFPVEMMLYRSGVGAREFYTASFFDLTERREAAAQIERQRDALRQTEKLAAMGSLLAGVAHELNNPLAIVMGRASLLEDKLLGSPLADDAHRIREAAERCGRIVRTFLNMARRKPAARAPVQLDDLARSAAALVAHTLRSHGIALELVLHGALPPLPADADQLTQVVLNLLVNAQHALAQSPGPRRIVLATGAGDAGQWLQVHDSGPGVPAALRERIFEPFFTTKGEGLGTGLGLSVSRDIARAHGGDLVVQAADGAGACFVLSLPATGAGATVPAAPAPAAATAARRVLVVDDEPEILELMRAMLESAGFAVDTAASADRALQLLDAAAFDAVVSDLHMPGAGGGIGAGGAALWRELRKRQPALAARVLFVTGDALSPLSRDALAGTRCPVLDKPFTKADLLGALRQLLQR